MAIGKYSAVPPPASLSAVPAQPPPSASASAPSQQPAPASSGGAIDIEAWTIAALQSLSVSPDSRGTGGLPLAIPLDGGGAHGNPHVSAGARVTIGALQDAHARDSNMTPPRRPPSRRDSMRRREALLKGKEGSRQRRRWDMARLTDVPHVEPPLPSDWEPRPVYPVHHIPYHVAQFWDRGLREQVEDKKAAARSGNKRGHPSAGGRGGKGRVPRDLRETVKRTPGVAGWVRSLEEPVRRFLVDHGAVVEAVEEGRLVEPADRSESDFSDDEVVFVGRKSGLCGPGGGPGGAAPGTGWKAAHREVHDRPVDRGMIFDSLEDDESGAFKRWLTHSISDYYGLDSRSVTMGTPARRCVYVGVREADLVKGVCIYAELPRPLWEHF